MSIDLVVQVHLRKCDYVSLDGINGISEFCGFDFVFKVHNHNTCYTLSFLENVVMNFWKKVPLDSCFRRPKAPIAKSGYVFLSQAIFLVMVRHTTSYI